jgi:hypothetical protein
MAALVVALLSACTPLVRTRTLPPSIRAVYVPMAVNRSAEPGVEERVTVAVQEELLADGRLDVVPERQADALLSITITDFTRRSGAFDQDDYPAGQTYEAEAEVEIIENIPGHPTIGGKRKVRSIVFFNADPRTTTFDPEPRTKESSYRSIARQIVNEVITGEFAEYSPDGTERPADSTQTRPAI